jgi:hypothetical protein
MKLTRLNVKVAYGIALAYRLARLVLIRLSVIAPLNFLVRLQLQDVDASLKIAERTSQNPDN